MLADLWQQLCFMKTTITALTAPSSACFSVRSGWRLFSSQCWGHANNFQLVHHGKSRACWQRGHMFCNHNNYAMTSDRKYLLLLKSMIRTIVSQLDPTLQIFDPTQFVQ
ncbi:unnamed protein product [Mycena citricolor]|uniref:Uncharacterized protein n=1 Tax=Mycena citricolor TaxID=2018698 RepID=A0AAD2Q2L1_9AGAR|nr:unnamed protein product [Mycena citricolor]